MAKNTPRMKALKLAIQKLTQANNENRTRAHAAKYGIRFGILAQQRFEEYKQAIEILTEMLNEEKNNQ